MMDSYKWMESMKGTKWRDLVKKEQALTLAAVSEVAPLAKQIEKELTERAEKEKKHAFMYYKYKVRATNTLHYEWQGPAGEVHGSADLDATSQGIWYIEDEGEGAEVYMLKHEGDNSWKYENPVGPFVAVLNKRVYCIESQNSLWYYRLISLDAATGKDRRVLFEMKDARWNLALVKAQNKCLCMLANKAGKQRLWHIGTEGLEEVYGYESFVPVGLYGKEHQFFGRRPGSTRFEPIGSRLPQIHDGTPEYYSLRHDILITRAYGKKTIHYRGKTRTLVGEVKPNLFLDWVGVPNSLDIHESDGKMYYAKSKDGTRVPYVLVGGKGKPRGLLVIGYGAYGLPTGLNTGRWLPLLRRGISVCFALVRGGGDHDDAWAEVARRDQKVKSVEDFEAVIVAASRREAVAPQHVAIYGRSAGGYLVGATLSRNPHGDLFGSLYTEVPYLDVMATTSNPKLPLTQLEYNEFGDPVHRKKDAAAILRLSPVDTVPAGGAPAVFVLCRTGLNDKEVFAYESVKWITKLKNQEGPGGKQKLLAIGEGEGHFVSGQRLFNERAEDLALLFNQMARRKSNYRIYKMVGMTRRNRKNNMMSRKNRKNNVMSRKNRKNNVMSRKNRKNNVMGGRRHRKNNTMMGGRKRKGSRKARKNNVTM
jgi:protease II